MSAGKLKITHPYQDGTPIPAHQTSIWLCESAVQDTAEGRLPTGDVVYAGESVSSGPDNMGMILFHPKCNINPGIWERCSKKYNFGVNASEFLSNNI